MYNEKFLLQLNELKYLQAVKKSNVNAISKKNSFGDMIKFYAQINKKDVIQKISYKASGCTHFLVFGNYFCQLAEGKSVEDALKIDSASLESLTELDETKKHVIDIIINTFALLVKKYRKGVEEGKITPAEVEEKKPESVKPKKEKKVKAKVEEKETKKKEKKEVAKVKKEKKEIAKQSEKLVEKETSTTNTMRDISNISKMIRNMEKSLKDSTTDQPKVDTNEKKLSSIMASLESMKQNNQNQQKTAKEIKEEKRLNKKLEKEAKKQEKKLKKEKVK